VNESLLAEIEQSRFRPTRLREGYDMGEVDAFLDDLCTLLRSGEPIAGLIGEVRFTPVRLREGYDMDDVDSLLQHVASSVGSVPTGETSPAAEEPAPVDTGWRNPISEVRSPLSRLFQRREQR